jgi:hypothetical protein
MTGWKRFGQVAGSALLGVLLLVGPAMAQDQGPDGTPAPVLEGGNDPAFSAAVIRELGLPEATLSAGPDGVVAPDSLQAGVTLVTIETPRPFIAFAAVMQPPAGMPEDEAAEWALAAAQADLAQPDWRYWGGTNTPGAGASASFVVDLPPGAYRWAISWYGPDPGSEEVMTLLPLTVTGDGVPASIPSAIDLVATDGLRFTLSPDPAPAGPAVWRFANESAASPTPHHAVLWRVPEGATAEQLVAGFEALVSGTPAPGDPIIPRLTWVGYFALQSPGVQSWAEFDLTPGRYAVTSFVLDPETQRPQILDGMAVVFDVEA